MAYKRGREPQPKWMSFKNKDNRLWAIRIKKISRDQYQVIVKWGRLKNNIEHYPSRQKRFFTVMTKTRAFMTAKNSVLKKTARGYKRGELKRLPGMRDKKWVEKLPWTNNPEQCGRCGGYRYFRNPDEAYCKIFYDEEGLPSGCGGPVIPIYSDDELYWGPEMPRALNYYCPNCKVMISGTGD
jgi:predicted DNA-binding WGR domain protein